MYFVDFSCNRKLGATSPTVTVPYSGPVNLLKALNYHSHTSMSGMDLPPPQSSPATTPHPQDSMRVRQLAHTYSTEVLSPVQSNSYKLASVVVHLGDVLSGHFVTYRRAPSVNGQRFPTRWLYTSDTLVKRATPSEVFGANAYMLFYEKIWWFTLYTAKIWSLSHFLAIDRAGVIAQSLLRITLDQNAMFSSSFSALIAHFTCCVSLHSRPPTFPLNAFSLLGIAVYS